MRHEALTSLRGVDHLLVPLQEEPFRRVEVHLAIIVPPLYA
jgi:hypothetical protein